MTDECVNPAQCLERLSILETDLGQIKEQTSGMPEIVENVRHTRKMLTGNGSPDNGVVVRQVRMEEQLGHISDKLTAHCSVSRKLTWWALSVFAAVAIASSTGFVSMVIKYIMSGTK